MTHSDLKAAVSARCDINVQQFLFTFGQFLTVKQLFDKSTVLSFIFIHSQPAKLTAYVFYIERITEMLPYHISVHKRAKSRSCLHKVLVLMRHKIDIEILIRKMIAVIAVLVLYQLWFNILIIIVESVTMLRLHQTAVYLEIIYRLLFVDVLVRLSENLSLKLQPLHYLPNLGHLRAINQNVIIRHLPHTDLGVPILDDAAFQRTVPNAGTLKLGENRLPLEIKRNILADSLHSFLLEIMLNHPSRL